MENSRADLLWDVELGEPQEAIWTPHRCGCGWYHGSRIWRVVETPSEWTTREVEVAECRLCESTWIWGQP